MFTESQTLEFKSIWKDDYLKTICAFANGEGGQLLIGVNDEGEIMESCLINQPHQSKPFNPTMAAVFYKCGFIENWGRGTLNIIDYCLEAGLPKPEFAYTWGAVRTTFYKKQQVAEQVTDPVAGQVAPPVTPPVTPPVAPPVMQVIRLLSKHGELGNTELREQLNINDRKHIRKAYIDPALELGLIEMTIPDKPNSRLQKYRLTEQGKQTLAAHHE